MDDDSRLLAQLAESLARIEAQLAQLVPPADVRQSIQDGLDTLNLVGQIAELKSNQIEQLCVLVGLAAQLLTEARDESAASAGKRDDTNVLLIQLRELGRKHVRGLADLERAAEWHESEAERRDGADDPHVQAGEAERRKAAGF